MKMYLLQQHAVIKGLLFYKEKVKSVFDIKKKKFKFKLRNRKINYWKIMLHMEKNTMQAIFCISKKQEISQ